MTKYLSEEDVTKGQCLCGKVKFEVDGGLGETRLCYCSKCRRGNGSAFSANVRVELSAYRLLSGHDVLKEYESSPGAVRAFCSECGSPLYARVMRDPEGIRIRLGSLEKNAPVRVAAHVWVGSKADWYEIEGPLPQFEEAPV